MRLQWLLAKSRSLAREGLVTLRRHRTEQVSAAASLLELSYVRSWLRWVPPNPEEIQNRSLNGEARRAPGIASLLQFCQTPPGTEVRTRDPDSGDAG